MDGVSCPAPNTNEIARMALCVDENAIKKNKTSYININVTNATQVICNDI